MPIEICWENDIKTGLGFHFRGDWDWRDCREALQTASFLHDDVEHDVSYFFDLTENRVATRVCINHLQKLVNTSIYPAPKRIIVIGTGFRFQMLLDVFEKLLPKNPFHDIEFAESIGEAFEQIEGGFRLDEKSA